MFDFPSYSEAANNFKNSLRGTWIKKLPIFSDATSTNSVENIAYAALVLSTIPTDLAILRKVIPPAQLTNDVKEFCEGHTRYSYLIDMSFWSPEMQAIIRDLIEFMNANESTYFLATPGPHSLKTAITSVED